MQAFIFMLIPVFVSVSANLNFFSQRELILCIKHTTQPVHHKDFPVLLGQSQKRLGQPVVLDQDHGPSHREGRVFPRVAVIYRKLGHFCLGQFFQRCETLLAAADLAIAVARLAFQHLLAVAVKGVLLVLVVAVRFQVLTSLRAGRQFFSSPFAHYSFTSGLVWPVFGIYLKKFFAAHNWLLSFRSG
ncbi:hypothetical protein [Ruthenibacterium lactatiformans]|uniref:hypothetical protein n=1 Tax=Ruthenibacterium lactatiformans TaxID=1550024 RepID=UPI001968889F|nr:hypothetical protein [Ruthenibacterium lactatiformans]MBN3030307.1 hypothetical protein [Ruthenibacterium lactatiformans]